MGIQPQVSASGDRANVVQQERCSAGTTSAWKLLVHVFSARLSMRTMYVIVMLAMLERTWFGYFFLIGDESFLCHGSSTNGWRIALSCHGCEMVVGCYHRVGLVVLQRVHADQQA